MPVEIAPGIEVDPNVRLGRPVIRGTRVPVDMVLSKLAGGMTPEEVVGEYGITPGTSGARSLMQPGSSVMKRSG